MSKGDNVNDRNLAEHGINDSHYWYSVSDGFRLVLWLRQKYLNYDGQTDAKAGEEYTYFRENNNRILITDPYHSDNFSGYLNDDINRIIATDDFIGQSKWTGMPTTIIIPLLSGLHWKTIKIEINYDNKTASILFDDPYGKGAFSESSKSDIKQILKDKIAKLISLETNDEDFDPNSNDIQEIEKEIDQQGHGENSWDCGSITFSNIEDYVKATVNATELVYSIPLCNSSEHDRTVILTRANHVYQYSKVAAVPIDQSRLYKIEEHLIKINQQQQKNLKKLSFEPNIDYNTLTDLEISILLAVLESKRLSDGKDITSEYTSEELTSAYQVVLKERENVSKPNNTASAENLDNTKKTEVMKEKYDKQELATDLDRLVQVKLLVIETTANLNDSPNLNVEILLKNLVQIGKTIHSIFREDENESIIRNEHGYRNPFDSNKKNTNGASLDFLSLSRLEDLTDNEECKKLLIAQPDLVAQSLNILKQKIDFILCKNYSSLALSQKSSIQEDTKALLQSQKVEESDLGFLRTIMCYYHDLNCIDKLLSNLNDMDTAWYKSLNLNNKEDRYSLGYFFVQLGETAKEISDFIKPEIEKNKDEDNLTRFLFGKLVGFRNVVKDDPAVVHSTKNNQLLQMKLILDEAQNQLGVFLQSIRKQLTIYQVGAGDATIAANIISNYPQFHKFSQPTHVSDFEGNYLKQIKVLTNILKSGTRGCIKEISSVTETISKIEASLQKSELLIEALKFTTSSNLETPKQKLLKAALNTNNAKQLINLSKLIIINGLLESSDFNEAQKELIKALAAVSELSKGKAPNGTAIEKFKKEITNYQKNLSTRIDEVEDTVKDVPEVSAYDHAGLCKLFAWLKSPDYRPKEVDSEYIKNKIISLQQKVSLTELELAVQKDCLSVLNTAKSKLLSAPPSSDDPEFTASSLPLSRFEKLVVQVIKETEFLQTLYTKFADQGTEKTLDEAQLNKLILATQMSFGFLGQVHKILRNNHQDKLDELLIINSILSDDCFEVIQVRHNELMHNVVNNTIDINILCQKIKDDIIPWLKDFQSILLLSNTGKIDGEQYNSMIESLKTNLPDKSQSEIELSLIHSMMQNFSRLTQHDKVIEVFNNVKTQQLMQSGVNVIIKFRIIDVAATSLYCQGNYPKLLELKNQQLKILSDDTFTEEKYSNLKAQVHYDTSVCQGKLENSDAELAHLGTAKALATNYYTKQAVTLGFGNYYLGKQMYEEASKSFEECKTQIESTGFSNPNDYEFLYQCCTSLNVAYGELEREVESITVLNEAEKLILTKTEKFKALHGEYYQHYLANLYIYKAGELRELGHKHRDTQANYQQQKCQEALGLYYKAWAYYQTQKDSPDKANLYLQMGNCCRDLKNYRVAKNNFEKAEEILIKLYGTDTIILDLGHVQAALACTYKRLSQDVKAVKYHKMAIEIFDQIGKVAEDYKQVQLKNWEALSNFKGKGLCNQEDDPSYWHTYTKLGMDDILKLRLKAEDLENMNTFSPNYVYDGSAAALRFAKDVAEKAGEKMLVTLNFYYKHWIGLVIEKISNQINVNYMDPEQQPMPALLKAMLGEALANAHPEQQINMTEIGLELQKYNNCGPEVIENFMQYLTGHRVSQEDAVPVHSLLYEDSITLAGNC